MQCPKCGYIVGDLETECLRCKRGGAIAEPPAARTILALAEMPAEKECPRCGKATGTDAALCDKCGYAYQTDDSRAERYQARLAEEARTAAPPPSALRRTLPPALSWSIIGASLLAIGVAGWAMFGGMITGEEGAETDSSASVALRPYHKHRHAAPHNVTLKVAGTALLAAVTYRGQDGVVVSTSQSVPLPWTQSFQAKAGAPLAVAARPDDPANPAAVISVEIDVDGVPQAQTKAPDTDGLTRASATL